MNIILETKRLYLRQLCEDDAKRMSEYRNKKEVAKYQSWKTYSLKDASRRIQQCMRIEALNTPHTNYHLAFVLKDNHTMIGDLFVDVSQKKTFTLGYTMDSEYWSYGYATEIVSAFIDYMKEEYGFQKVICYIYKRNIRSKKLLLRLNFKKFDESFFYQDEGYMKILE